MRRAENCSLRLCPFSNNRIDWRYACATVQTLPSSSGSTSGCTSSGGCCCCSSASPMMGLGFGYILREAYGTLHVPGLVYYVTLQFIPRYVRGALFLIGQPGPHPLLRLEAQPVAALGLHQAGAQREHRQHHLHPALPAPRPQDRRHRRRHGSLVAAARPQGVHRQPHGDRHGRRRRRLLGPPAARAGRAAPRRHPQLHRRPGRRRAADVTALPVPLLRRLRARGPRFGNLFIVAMSGVAGNFEDAVRETSACPRRARPDHALHAVHVTLCARTDDGTIVRGESASRSEVT